jgi:hypothetical protein
MLLVVEISAHHVDQLMGVLPQAVVWCGGWTIHRLSPIRCDPCVANEPDPADNAGESAPGAVRTRPVRTLETTLLRANRRKPQRDAAV